MLQLARICAGGLAAAGFTTGLGFSLDEDAHPVKTYLILFGGAAVFSLLFVVLWVVIERRKAAQGSKDDALREHMGSFEAAFQRSTRESEVPGRGSMKFGPIKSRAVVRPQSRVLSPHETSDEGESPPIPDKPVRMELSDEAQEVVAAELAEHGPRGSERIDTAALARRLREHYSRGRPILMDAENAPDRGAIYRTNQRFTEWGAAIEETLTNQLFHRMAAFAMSLERPDPPAPRLLFSVQALLSGGTGEVGPGGHGPLRT